MNSQSLGFRANDIARWFINSTDRESGDAMTHLKLQKLLYYAQGWSFAHFERGLFDEDFQAWAHGPVVVSVWDQFKIYSWEAIPLQKIQKKIDGEPLRLLQGVNDKYGIYTAKELERRTHREHPWKTARGNLPPEARCTNIIPVSDIKAFFSSLKSGLPS